MREQQCRQWALAVLQAAPPPPFATAADQFRFEHWLRSLAADVAAASPTPAAAAHALAVVQVMMLEAEVAVLMELLLRNP